MRNQGVLEINQLNKEFYKKHAVSFSNSRDMNFWRGFEVCKMFITPTTSVLDLGCGNARFLQFLKSQNISFKSYLGVDSEESFISENKVKYPEGNFQTQDILEFENFHSIEPKDFVAVFGVTHHIPEKKYRLTWFENLEKLVNKNGYLIISFWNFDKNKSTDFVPKFYKIEENDYFLGWKQDFSVLRYCHYFNKEELKEIILTLSKFNLIEEFEADYNFYLIFKKN